MGDQIVVEGLGKMKKEPNVLLKKLSDPKFFVPILVGVGIIFVLYILVKIIPQYLTSPSTTSVVPVQSVSVPTPQPIPVVTLSGKITCLFQKESESCKEYGITVENGATYKIDAELAASTSLLVGQSATISGVIQPASGENSSGSGSSQSQSSSSPQIAGVLASVPAPTPTPWPVNGQAPAEDNSLPPGNGNSQYGTVKYILDHRRELQGKIVDVSAYLIDGRIGQNFCQVINPCDHWELALGDVLTDNLSNNYWIKVYLHQTEAEGDYSIGQRVSLRAKVLLNGNETYLEKQY